MAIIPTKDNLLKQQRDMINFILSKDESDEIKMSTCVEIKDTLNQMFKNWTDTFLENTIFTVDSKVLAVEVEEKNLLVYINHIKGHGYDTLIFKYSLKK